MSRQTAINIGAQIISLVVTFGISFFLTPFIVRNIGVDSFGYIGLTNNFINFIQIITVAINSMAGRFITISLYKGETLQAKKYFASVFFSNLFIVLILTGPVVFILLNLSDYINIPAALVADVTMLVGLMFIVFCMNVLGTVFGVAAFARNRLDLLSVADIVGNLIKVAVLVSAFSLFIPKLTYVAVAMIISTSFMMILNIYYTRKLLPEINIRYKYFELKSIKEILSAGIWNSLTRLSSFLSKGLSLLITNLFIGPGAMGLLAVSQTIPNTIGTIISKLSDVFAPDLTISFAHEDNKKMLMQLNTSIKILGFFSAIPLAILFTYGEHFFELWLPGQDADLLHRLSILICLGFTVALPMEGIWNVFTVVNKVKQTSFFLLGNAALTLLLMFAGLSLIDDSVHRLYVVASVEAFVSLISSLIFLPIYAAKCMNVSVKTFYPPILKNTISLLLIVSLSFYLKELIDISGWLTFIMLCLLTAIISVLINSFFLLNRYERKVLTSIILKKK
ncbi:lipopolysaccharide biosynthesis protein [Jeotgalibacillus haloalkalitolerans]|uniref:MATE family efflux transporter n=1 Tax=Jeotgalibacillus haloalkalitolerans TaxID=3104292 RepID=A0ABU5KJL0_9BACL|nr:MATE family efflux transporter [Jeotgalibacillus sp. HH7-29]MDZ5711444.1 MATE family efflux transporter [Jeotgalibacillus sp. HH7-29]